MLLDEDLEVCSGARKGSGCGLLEYVVAIRTWTSWTAWYCEGSCIIGEFFCMRAFTIGLGSLLPLVSVCFLLPSLLGFWVPQSLRLAPLAFGREGGTPLHATWPTRLSMRGVLTLDSAGDTMKKTTW